MSVELVPTNSDITQASDRRAALERLSIAAETTDSPETAREIMLKGRAAAELLLQARAPYEEAWLAGKASVLAARRLGVLLLQIPAKALPMPIAGGRGGFAPSPRGELVRELGMTKSTVRPVLRLGQADDPSFQRYVQDRTRIPSLTSAARLLGGYDSGKSGGSVRDAHRKRIGVKAPANPSLDEAYSLIVKALGHLGSESSNARASKSRSRSATKDIARALQHLYEAEDLLKPYRAGYGE